MKVTYDEEVDAAHIRLSRKRPQGAIEIQEGFILHLTEENELVAIEILDASKRMPLKSLFSFEVAR